MANTVLYSFIGSQWAGVAHLAISHQGLVKDKDYTIKEIDLVTGDNFDPAYIAINPNGTIPSLTSPTLPSPLTESTTVLRHLAPSLTPTAPSSLAKSNAIVAIVHSSQLDTNILFFHARSVPELDAKKTSWHKPFITVRHERLLAEQRAHQDHPFYASKSAENSPLYDIYQAAPGVADEAFFVESEKLYTGFAEGMEKLEKELVLPYAAGEELTEADFHMVPWLAHGMIAAGSDEERVSDFSTLEAVLGKSAPGFKVGPRTREWWATMGKEKAFQEVFPTLH